MRIEEDRTLLTISTNLVNKCNNCGTYDYQVIAKSRDFEYRSCANEFEYIRCCNCNLVYLRNRPDISSLNIIYPSNYKPHQFEKRLGKFISKIRDMVQKNKVRIVKEFASINSFIIDVGCGDAKLLKLLRDYGHASWRLCGVDISQESVDAVEKLGLKAYLGRFESLDWTDDSPDIIIMNQVIEHLEDPHAVVQKAYKLLKPGGYFIIETPSLDGWDAKLFGRKYWGGWHTPRHWTLYSEETLSYLFQKVGFHSVAVEYILSPTFWLQSVHHYIEDKWKIKPLASLFDNSILPTLFIASFIDYVQLRSRGKTSNFRMIGQKNSQ